MDHWTTGPVGRVHGGRSTHPVAVQPPLSVASVIESHHTADSQLSATIIGDGETMTVSPFLCMEIPFSWNPPNF